jgi:hypothetical protein
MTEDDGLVEPPPAPAVRGLMIEVCPGQWVRADAVVMVRGYDRPQERDVEAVETAMAEKRGPRIMMMRCELTLTATRPQYAAGAYTAGSITVESPHEAEVLVGLLEALTGGAPPPAVLRDRSER